MECEGQRLALNLVTDCRLAAAFGATATNFVLLSDAMWAADTPPSSNSPKGYFRTIPASSVRATAQTRRVVILTKSGANVAFSAAEVGFSTSGFNHDPGAVGFVFNTDPLETVFQLVTEYGVEIKIAILAPYSNADVERAYSYHLTIQKL